MENIQRIYQSVVKEHLHKYGDKIILLAGPRQVGKTTLGHMCLEASDYNEIYLNWDLKNNRQKITSGFKKIITKTMSPELSEFGKTRVVYFDELHKYRGWKSLLRGYHTELGEDDRIIVTGSASMESHKRGGESLKGISLLYHVYPITVGELARARPKAIGINEPAKIAVEEWDALLNFGGFPDPFLRSEQSYYNRWSKDRDHQLFEQDLVSSDKSMNITTMEKIAEQLKNQVKHVSAYNTLSSNFGAKKDEIRYFISKLENHYY